MSTIFGKVSHFEILFLLSALTTFYFTEFYLKASPFLFKDKSADFSMKFI